MASAFSVSARFGELLVLVGLQMGVYVLDLMATEKAYLDRAHSNQPLTVDAAHLFFLVEYNRFAKKWRRNKLFQMTISAAMIEFCGKTLASKGGPT